MLYTWAWPSPLTRRVNLAQKKVSRRKFIAAGAGVVAVAIVAGVADYVLTRGPSSSTPSFAVTSPAPLKNEIPSGTIRIGFAHVSLAAPYYVAMQKTAQTVAAQNNVNLTIDVADMDPSKQNSQIDSMLASGIDGLLINPVTTLSPKPEIVKCYDAGIPVGAIDRQLFGDYLVYSGIDQYQAGYVAGQYMATQVFPKGASIVELTGDPGDPATIGRGQGFHDGVTKFAPGKFDFLAQYEADYSQSLGHDRAKDAISGFGNKIQAFWAHNDAMNLGAIQAVQEAGMTGITFAGVDSQKEALQLIQQGKQSWGQYACTVTNPPVDITKGALTALINFIRNGASPTYTDPAKLSSFVSLLSDPTKYILVGTQLVNPGNVSQYYDPNALF